VLQIVRRKEIVAWFTPGAKMRSARPSGGNQISTSVANFDVSGGAIARHGENAYLFVGFGGTAPPITR